LDRSKTRKVYSFNLAWYSALMKGIVWRASRHFSCVFGQGTLLTGC